MLLYKHSLFLLYKYGNKERGLGKILFFGINDYLFFLIKMALKKGDGKVSFSSIKTLLK